MKMEITILYFVKEDDVLMLSRHHSGVSTTKPGLELYKVVDQLRVRRHGGFVDHGTNLRHHAFVQENEGTLRLHRAVHEHTIVSLVGAVEALVYSALDERQKLVVDALFVEQRECRAPRVGGSAQGLGVVGRGWRLGGGGRLWRSGDGIRRLDALPFGFRGIVGRGGCGCKRWKQRRERTRGARVEG